MEEADLREKDPPFVCGVIDVSHLKTDISGRALIKDDNYNALWSEIDEAIERVIDTFCSQPVKIPSKVLEVD